MSLDRRDFLKMTAASAAMVAAGPAMLKSSAFAMNPTKFQATSDVSFVGSSTSGTRRKMIADVLEPWRTSVAAGITGKTILIKPNMVYWNTGITDPTLALTHVDAVRGLIDFLRTISSTVQIIVGECSGDSTLSTMWAKAGYDKLTTEYTGVTLMDLNDTTKMPSVTRHLWTTDFSASTTATIPITSAFVDTKYYVISITRPKSHNCMVMTGVNKNMLMGAPLRSAVINNATVSPKEYMHGQNGWYNGQHTNEDKCLAYNLYQIGNVLFSDKAGSPALSVLDAWEGMQGEGPTGGTSIMQYCAVAGIDSLAVDRLCAKLMGFSDTATDPINKATPSYTDMRALLWLSNAGFGNYDLSKINFILGSLTTLQTYIKSYKLAANYTGSPSYETEWTTNGSAPTTVFDGTSIGTSRTLDPKPFLSPQMEKSISAQEVKIQFSLPVAFSVHLGIYNMQGTEVCRLGSEYLQAGRYTMVWNRKNSAGSRVPSGHYIIKLSFDSRSLCDHVSLVN